MEALRKKNQGKTVRKMLEVGTPKQSSEGGGGRECLLYLESRGTDFVGRGAISQEVGDFTTWGRWEERKGGGMIEVKHTRGFSF